LGRVAEWMGRSAMGCWGLAELRIAVARRGEEPHPYRGELQVRAEAGSKAERRRVVGLGFVAGRARSWQWQQSARKARMGWRWAARGS